MFFVTFSMSRCLTKLEFENSGEVLKNTLRQRLFSQISLFIRCRGFSAISCQKMMKLSFCQDHHKIINIDTFSWLKTVMWTYTTGTLAPRRYTYTCKVHLHLMRFTYTCEVHLHLTRYTYTYGITHTPMRYTCTYKVNLHL
jgi:hypothetical protein